jgi:hypothetical protein
LVFPALETLSPALETAPITSDLWCGIPSPGNTISSPGEHTNLLVFPALETLSPALETAPITSDLWCGIPSPGNTISSPGEHTNLLYSETPKKERVLDVINLNDIRPIVQLNLWKPALATVKKSPISALGITILGLNARLTLHDNPLLDV